MSGKKQAPKKGGAPPAGKPAGKKSYELVKEKDLVALRNKAQPPKGFALVPSAELAGLRRKQKEEKEKRERERERERKKAAQARAEQKVNAAEERGSSGAVVAGIAGGLAGGLSVASKGAQMSLMEAAPTQKITGLGPLFWLGGLSYLGAALSEGATRAAFGGLGTSFLGAEAARQFETGGADVRALFSPELGPGLDAGAAGPVEVLADVGLESFDRIEALLAEIAARLDARAVEPPQPEPEQPEAPGDLVASWLGDGFAAAGEDLDAGYQPAPVDARAALLEAWLS
jgi:hypothetical protein